MECLVDFVKVDGDWDDWEHLLDIMESDPDNKARHALARLLIDNPPFSRQHRNPKLDRPSLVDRIWNNMK